MENTADKAALRDNGRSFAERQGISLQTRGLHKGYNGHEVLTGTSVTDWTVLSLDESHPKSVF